VKSDKREVDFLMTFEKKPWFAVECKVKAGVPNPSLILQRNINV
jgi:hypothetical protein